MSDHALTLTGGRTDILTHVTHEVLEKWAGIKYFSWKKYILVHQQKEQSSEGT